ncbi:unnamed protein product [Polarella glacialis]|uniref:Plastid lipid-associated protein/fibrillin conserved domain-containing protein n=1 Tax=Polarella glacialis TaxID=89957 RepID=A0A813JSN0_POLGL|nr:unnamed protein product [Polarella glacialis]CAE8685495.1 unnamed protein product [Polarella glacialis]
MSLSVASTCILGGQAGRKKGRSRRSVFRLAAGCVVLLAGTDYVGRCWHWGFFVLPGGGPRRNEFHFAGSGAPSEAGEAAPTDRASPYEVLRTSGPRRELLLALTTAAVSVFAIALAPARAATGSADIGAAGALARQKLLQLLLPKLDLSSLGHRGAPATSLMLSAAESAEVSSLAARLEKLNPFPTGLSQDTLALQLLNGSWRLLYTDAPEITALAALPLGFELGPVFQPIDVILGSFENQALVLNSAGIAEGNLRVVGSFRAAPLGSLNAAGIANEAGDRLDVNFDRLVFSLDRLLGISTDFRRVVSPKPAPGAAQPAVDITYLDESLRITRGGDGSLFVLLKVPAAAEEGQSVKMLDAAQRAKLTAEGAGKDVLQGSGVIDWAKSLGGDSGAVPRAEKTGFGRT